MPHHLLRGALGLSALIQVGLGGDGVVLVAFIKAQRALDREPALAYLLCHLNMSLCFCKPPFPHRQMGMTSARAVLMQLRGKHGVCGVMFIKGMARQKSPPSAESISGAA